MTPLHQSLHEQLLNAATLAANTGRPNRLGKIVQGLKDDEIRRQVLLWIDRYTVVVADPEQAGQFKYSREKKLNWSLHDASNIPFWVFGKPKRTSQSISQRSRNGQSSGSSSERDIEKNHLRSALNRFIVHPSYANKENLVQLLGEFQGRFLQTTSPVYVPISSGGLPSLGKRGR